MALKKNPQFDIKQKYYRVFQISLIISLSLLILAFKYFPDVEKSKLVPTNDKDYTRTLPPVTGNPTPAPPPRPRIPIEALSEDEVNLIEFQATDWNLKEDVAPPPPPKVADDSPIPDVIFRVVEQMPEPLGGIEEIQKRIVYPDFAVRAGIQGRVFVKAFVDENGNVFKVELQKGIGGGCDEAAMEVVKNSLFSPGKQRGKPVKVQVTIPILFKLR
jgi:periplasmic protein TonB